MILRQKIIRSIKYRSNPEIMYFERSDMVGSGSDLNLDSNPKPDPVLNPEIILPPKKRKLQIECAESRRPIRITPADICGPAPDFPRLRECLERINKRARSYPIGTSKQD